MSVSILTKKGPYMKQYSCKHVGIWANLNQARNRDSGFSKLAKQEVKREK